MPDALGALVALFVWLKVVSGMSYTIDYDDSSATIALDTAPMVEQVTQMALVSMRAGARVEYESVVYDPRAGSLTIAGLEVDMGQGPSRIDRLEISGIADDAPLDIRVAFEGLDAPVAALNLPSAAMLQFNLLGLDRLQGDGAVDLAYVVETSDLKLDGAIELAGVGRVGLEVDVEALRFNMDREAPEAEVTRIALAFENDGALEAIGPGFGVDPENPEAGRRLAATLSQQMLAVLSEGKQPLPAFTETANAVETALARFFERGDSIALTLTPEPPLSLREIDTLDQAVAAPDGRAAMIERLGVKLAARPTLRAPVIVDLALPETASVDDRLRVATALRTGVGAPRDLDAALGLLAPAASTGDPQAAALTAEILLEKGDPDDAEAAYAFTLIGLAGGVDGAAAQAATLAAALPAQALLDAERAAIDQVGADADALADLRAEALNGDAAAMRRLAQALDAGQATLRDTPEAYRWAVLGAAAGDAAAVRLRDRIAGRFAAGSADDREAWRAMLAESAAAATEAWSSGLAAKVVAQRAP